MSKILIIEDDINIARLEQDYLNLNNYDVEIETDGMKGLNSALTSDFNLIILDIMLPSADGFTILKRIREEKNIPILMVSSKTEEIDKIRALGIGADDYIIKPFSPNELVARVIAHINRYNRLTATSETPNSCYSIHGLNLYPDEHRATINNEELTLTNKEFEILSLFIKNPNHVYTKEQIINNIWGYDSLIDYNTITVHINRLRDKIEADPSNPQYIETIWGVGYRLKV